MGEIKDRNIPSKELKKATIIVRVTEKDKQRLSAEGSPSEKIRQLIEKRYSSPKTSYKCDKCGSKISVGDLYYITLEHIEKYVSPDEIEVITGAPLTITCASCSKNKIAKLIASPGKAGSKVKEMGRDLNQKAIN